LLMDGYEKYGFMYLMGNLIGMYATDSGAKWFDGTDYTNPEHQKRMLESVRKMVEEYKDKPYILMWVLGNENNYAEPGVPGETSGNGCCAKLQPEAYYTFVNEAAKLIKSLDPLKRPVAVSNGDTLFLDICAEKAPELDVFGVNAYRGEQGFGSLWADVSDVFGRPVMITEYGCSAYHPTWTQKQAEEGQAKYLKGNWMDIEANAPGMGTGNALGGILFEWTDEWWKANSDLPLSIQQQKKAWYAERSAAYKNLQPEKHDSVPQFGAPFLDGWSYEEWLGITSQGDGSDSPFLRQLRPSYFTYKKMWEKYRK
jgi:beta-galactosidase/beta-glucuronidase